MKKFIQALTIVLALSFTALYAEHTDHKHKTLSNAISSEAVQNIAIKEVKKLASQKKISKSWKSIPILKIGRTHYGDNDDWIVIFNNPKIKKKLRKNLYIFVSKQGKIRGANYTGM